MKTITHFFTVILFVFSTAAYTQPQLSNWFISPSRVEIPPTGQPVVSPIANSSWGTPPVAATNVANGMYDNAGNLLFYVANGNVYDYNNTVIGTIPNNGAEVAIVPFGNNDNCQSKFSIFSTEGGFTSTSSLWQSVLDMKRFSFTTTMIDSINYQGNPSTEFAAIAVGKANAALDRYLYFLAGPGTIGSPEAAIKKLVVHNDGTVTSTGRIYPTAANPNSNAGGEVFTRELELSPDGKWLAWASFAGAINNPAQLRYHFIKLDASTGNYIPNSYSQFNIPNITGNNVSGFRGVEFWQSGSVTKLFIGAGSDGIFSINLPLANTPPIASDFTFVTNSTAPLNFGLSQIELGFNGNMYANSTYVSPTVNNVGGFDPASPFPSIPIGSPSFPLQNPPNVGWLGVNLFTLPDQIDGQDYSLMTPPSITAVPTTNTYICSTAVNTNWAYASAGGTNPWNTSTPVQVFKELRIKNNTNLTITGMIFKFSPEAKVIIEKGSSLTLDGTVFTSNYIPKPCDVKYTWKGVEVWGDKNASQFTANAQGKLTLKNYSRIEFAQCGARAYNPVIISSNNPTTGGIITVSSSSTFYNNNIDVDFKPYENKITLPSGTIKIFSNRSSFTACSFNTNQDYPFTTAPVHVQINGCNGIIFSGCSFNQGVDPAIDLFRSIGIKATESGFTVKSNSAFFGLWHGIDAVKGSVNKPFGVFQSEFTDNRIGIFTTSINGNTINGNTFYIGYNQYPFTIPHIGIALQSASGFTVEENFFFQSLNGSLGITEGIYIANSGSAANQIYKNNFERLNYGNFATLVNRDNSNPVLNGLQYLCNQNNPLQPNIDYDFYVDTKNGSSLHGICSNQGTNAIPAGNTFSHTNNGLFSDYNNNTPNPINYYYNSGSPAETPIYFNNPLVTPQPLLNIVNTCPSTSPCVPCYRLSPEELQTLSDDYDSSETAYLNLLYVYNQLMDGGSTNALLTQIQLNWSSDAVHLRDELLSRSPYLSQEILRNVAIENVLPQAMLLAVLMANPDATRDEQFLTFLQYEIPNPLPQYMIDMIRASWDNETARTTMESTLAQYSSRMAVSSDKILYDLYLGALSENDSIEPTDTTNYNIYIRYWLNRIQTLTAKYDLIENYFAAGEYNLAESLSDLIPHDFELSDDQYEAYTDYLFYYTFRKNITTNSGDLSLLTETQIQELRNFAESRENFATAMAYNLLCFYYAICPEESYELPEGGGGNRMAHSSSSENIYQVNKVTVSPNPASSIASFNYLLPSLREQATLVICDITGKTIQQFPLLNNQGHQIWNTQTVQSGLYYWYVKDGSTKIANGKIAVKK